MEWAGVAARGDTGLDLTMNVYAFVFRIEIADWAEGSCEMEALEALKRSEGAWEIIRTNGKKVKLQPQILPAHQMEQ